MTSQKTIIPRSRAKTSSETELGRRNLTLGAGWFAPSSEAAALAAASPFDDVGECEDDVIGNYGVCVIVLNGVYS
jgi:hypothetical protein